MYFFILPGIFAYLNYLTPRSRAEILEILINGLKRLEYRGYDSAGKKIYYWNIPILHSSLLQAKDGGLSFRVCEPSRCDDFQVLTFRAWTTARRKKRKKNMHKTKKPPFGIGLITITCIFFLLNCTFVYCTNLCYPLLCMILWTGAIPLLFIVCAKCWNVVLRLGSHSERVTTI